MADFNRYITAYEVVKRVLGQQSLPVPVSAASSQNAIDRQIWALFTEVGQDLMTEYEWQLRTKTFTITTTPGVSTYSLPSDFESFVDSTGWNMDARLPLIGPMSNQQWALLQARQLGGTTLRMQYRLNGDLVEFYAVPSQSQTITLVYIGRGWVIDATNPTTYRDYVANDGDWIMYPPRLIISALKRRFRIEKGLDATAANEEYEDALEKAKYNDAPKNDLSLAHRGMYPYLGYLNMPDTGYGSQ